MSATLLIERNVAVHLAVPNITADLIDHILEYDKFNIKGVLLCKGVLSCALTDFLKGCCVKHISQTGDPAGPTHITLQFCFLQICIGCSEMIYYIILLV